jgi:hypothetical protein
MGGYIGGLLLNAARVAHTTRPPEQTHGRPTYIPYAAGTPLQGGALDYCFCQTHVLPSHV